MDLHCPDCDFTTQTSELRSFGGKFCPVCGQRLVDALATETAEAKKSLRVVETVLATLYEIIDEPFYKRWGLKVVILSIFLIVLQGIGYAGYQVVQPLLLDPAIEEVDPAIMALFDEAHAAEAAQHFVEAEALYTSILDIDPANTRALNNIGFLARLQHDEDKALEIYNQVFMIDLENATARQNIGVIARERGDSDEAFAHFERVLELDDTNTTVRYLMADILIEKNNNLDRAEALLRDVIALLPTHQQAHLLLIDLYRTKGSGQLSSAIYEAKMQFPNDQTIQSLSN